jgi:ATP-dependent Clp protease ATP-binding subunit ClpA
MLFALLEEHDPRVEAVLSEESIVSSAVHAELKRALGTGEGRTWEGILVTPRVRKIVRLAEERAKSEHVEPIDLFVAIRSEGGGMAAEILRRAARGG